MPLIKRYPNRKLYDTEAKRYVTLDQIAQMVRDGQEVEVRDHESGEDLTSLTLSQILLAQEKQQSGFLPTDLMASLIRTGGDTLDFLLRSVQGTAGTSIQTVEQKLSRLVEAGKLSAEQARAVAQTLQQESSGELQRLDDSVTAVLQRLNIPTNRDISELRQKLVELTQQLNELVPDETGDSPPNRSSDSAES